MHRIWLAAMAALALMLPMAAQAQDGAALDCGFAKTTPAFRTALAQTMMVKSDNRNTLLGQLSAITTPCAEKAGYRDALARTYFDYTLHRINREFLIAQLAKFGLDAAVVDRAMDFGPGRTNPDLSKTGLTEDQGAAIVRGFSDAGVDLSSVPEEAWPLLGAYSAATSAYWKTRAQLSQ